MTDEEITELIDSMVFDDPGEDVVEVNVPLNVPKALFQADMVQIKAYAQSIGWQPELLNKQTGLHEPNPIGPLKFLALGIRSDVRRKFNRFIELQAKAQAAAAAKAQIEALGLED